MLSRLKCFDVLAFHYRQRQNLRLEDQCGVPEKLKLVLIAGLDKWAYFCNKCRLGVRRIQYMVYVNRQKLKKPLCSGGGSSVYSVICVGPSIGAI
jgi:hypothetical protein